MTQINIQVLLHGVGLGIPAHATEGSAGLDLRAAISDNVILRPLERCLIATGIMLAIPSGFEGQIRPRSGLAYKNGITVLNSPGTIDSDYRGELKALLINLSSENFEIERGMRIAQLVIHKYEHVCLVEVNELDTTERLDGGYGSTGVK